MHLPHRHRIGPWPLAVLAGALLASGCGGPVSPTADAHTDGAPSTDALADATVDAVAPRDAGDIPRFDGGPLPCEAPGYFDPHAARFSSFLLSEYGYAGYGLDVDGDNTTCSPQPWCSSGVDNQLGTLDATLCGSPSVSNFNMLMSTIIEQGSEPANWLLEARGLTLVGDSSAAPFTLVLHRGRWFPSSGCTQATDVLQNTLRCDYLTEADMFVWDSCDSLSTLPNAEIINGRLVAGGPAHTLWIVYTVFGLTAGVVLHHARLEANVFVSGDDLYLYGGLIGGVVCPAELTQILGAVLSVDPVACGMADVIPAPDLEVGCSADDPDGISAGFTFAAHPAHIVGMLND